MPVSGDIYSETVRLLGDLSRNHAAAAADMCRDALAQLADEGSDPVPDSGPPSMEVENLGALLRELEDVGLSAVARLACASDPDVAFRAFDEAHAEWLHGVILNRALETVGHIA
jgi:hypothetical protein